MILDEAKRLYDLGWAVHWIKPNSKAPVKSGWSGDTRDDWSIVKKEFCDGFGLGVRLGAPSHLPGGGYLANIDVDVKSQRNVDQQAALAVVKKEFPGVVEGAPVVRTGHGVRFFVRTEEPLPSGKITASPDTCVVHLPTTEVSQRQRLAVTEGLLRADQLADGYRVRPSWEVEFMSAGKQVVLPPSIHPETKKPYVWVGNKDLHLIPSVVPAELRRGGVRTGAGRPKGSNSIYGFEPVAVDLVGSSLSDRIIEMVLSGEGVSDRSAALFSVSLAMLKAGFSEIEILSVLTDRDNFLGDTAYEHRNTKARGAAAAWIRDYCLVKARVELDATRAFEIEVGVTPVLETEDAMEAQAEELGLGVTEDNWELKLKRTGKDGDGPPAPTLKNIVLVLENAVGEGVFKRDLFANRDAYGTDTPWGGKSEAAVTDSDGIAIKLWLANVYRFEPNVNIVFEAVDCIARRNSYHPVRDELETLPEWDGVERLDTWLKKNFRAKGSDEFLGQVFRKWLVASVTRTYEPGAKFDWMPILQGMQGTGKSTFGAILFGQDYFADWLPALTDKDAALGLQGRRCVEFGELDGLRRNEIETTKAFVTRQVDKVRPPYGRKLLELYRQCVFFGTTNRDEYFKDDTGNRRFIPVEVGQLRFGVLVRERDQLWAEALFIYRNGLESTLYLEGDAHTQAVEAQASKMVQDEMSFMVDSLKEWAALELAKPEAERGCVKFKLMHLFQSMGPLGRFQETSRNIQAAARALRVVGAVSRKIHGERWWRLLDNPKGGAPKT